MFHLLLCSNSLLCNRTFGLRPWSVAVVMQGHVVFDGVCKCSIDFKAVCREKKETDGGLGCCCASCQSTVSYGNWAERSYVWILSQNRGTCACILRTNVCLLSLRSHLFPKSVMQVSTAQTHATVIRTDCTDDVTAAKWMLDQWQISANTECSRIRRHSLYFTTNKSNDTGWWHSYTKIQCFLNAVQIQKCLSRKLLDKPSVPSPETVGLALLPAAVAVKQSQCVQLRKVPLLVSFSLFSPLRATRLALLILVYFITLIMLDDEYEPRSPSLCSFLQASIISSPLHLCCSQTLSACYLRSSPFHAFLHKLCL